MAEATFDRMKEALSDRYTVERELAYRHLLIF